MAKQFFVTVQNKLHFAIHGHTAAELIAERVDYSKENMGLTTWNGNKVGKMDITIAKNYLTEKEIMSLKEISWTNNIHIVSKIKSIEEKEFYIKS